MATPRLRITHQPVNPPAPSGGWEGDAWAFAAAHDLNRMWSVTPRVLWVNVTRAVIVRIPPPDATSAAHGDVLRVAIVLPPIENTTRRM